MTKVNFILFFVILLMALAKINSQHQSRKLYFELDQQKEIGQKLNSEYSQLQLEQSTWAMHGRIEEVAKKSLKMKTPEPKKIILLGAALSLFINNKVEKTFFELSGIRRRLILLLFLAGFLTLIFRAFYLQSLDKKFLQSKGNATSTRVISLYADRGKITDRNGDILAISSPVESVWVNPPNVKITKDQKLELENILKLSANEVDQKLLNNKKRIYISQKTNLA
jgi:cell division protein FtsL